MNDDELGRAYRAARAQRLAQPDAARPSPEALRSLVEGSLSPTDREALLEQVLASGATEELALLHSVAAGIPTERATGRRSWTTWWPMAAAAALVVAVGLPTLSRIRDGNAPPRYRGSDATSGPQLVRPASDAPASLGQPFVWARLNSATEYTLELMNDSGRTIARVVTKDTSASLPTSVADAQRQQLSGWRVAATMPDGSQRRSELRLLRASSTP